MNEEKKKILFIGIAGGLAQMTARLILNEHPDWEVIGIDSRDVSRVPQLKGLQAIQLKYSRGNFENLFRTHQFDVVYHLGRISHSSNVHNVLAKRIDLSVMGTNRILDLCERSHVKRVIILSTFHVYGALSDNSIFLTEEAPLRASIKHPELRDVIEMDQICTNWMWKHQNTISTIVLRPCNIIGTQIQNAMTKFLAGPIALSPMDFNPYFQFIHEFDMAHILYKSLNTIPTGTYNVAGDDFISLRDALKVVGTRGIPFPMMLAGGFNRGLKKFNIDVPEYLIDYLKFSCLISNHELKKHLGPNYLRFTIKEALELIKLR
ncbi:MAG TPA: NAD-dependent epimerase/dehydratase family protein [Bacteriovoracaceae bacterium]|nr:NAD-dependent epimerase/dehydratase family protein [Bacteriovoracaceae bacterium]